MAEFIVAILAMVLIVLAMVEFVPIFLENLGLLKEVREEAGTASLRAEAGTSAADRQDEFAADIPEFLMDQGDTSGHYSEKLRMPAANLACWEQVRIPSVANAMETLRYENRAGTAAFLSATVAGSPEQALARAESRAGTAAFMSALVAKTPEQALAQASSALAGAGWQLHEIRADDARIFTMGDASAPSAVAAAHAQYTVEGDGTSVLTIVARSSGSSL